jgi:hypothetical protein
MQTLRNEEEGLKIQTEQKLQEATGMKHELAEFTAECELRRATLQEEQTREMQDTEWEQRQQVQAPYSDEQIANRTSGISGGRCAHMAVSRRPPISHSSIVARAEGYAYDARVWDCPSFKGHFLSPRAKP